MVTSVTPPSGLSRDGALAAVGRALQTGNMAGALQIAAQAAAAGIAHPKLLTLAAHEALNRNDTETALAHAGRARELAPRDVDALNALGLALMRANRAREAVAVYESALRQMPGMAALRFNKACAHEELSELKRAQAEFERAMSLQPVYPEALARMAGIAVRRGDTAAARRHGQRALTQDSRQTAAGLALAMADIEDKQFGDALKRAAMLAQDRSATPINRSIAQGVMGDAYDGLGKPADAFAAYTASNQTRHAHFKPLIERPELETAPARVKRLNAYFASAPSEQWRSRSNERPESPVDTHVFLVGFPRSGTTLLENALAAHPDVETMEERDCLIDAVEDFIVPAGGLGRLAVLPEDDLAAARKAYWGRVAESGHAPKRKVFVDKMPLNLVFLPLVAKLFRHAKILFALRDPRDVVLSCFRRRFGMSAQMYQFLTLDGAARYYDGVMGLAETYRARLGLDTHHLKYEALVGDFEGETRRACAFLGLEWSAEIRDFAAKTKARDVNTPSAVQVARGLFTQGRGQWRAYEKQMAPVLPLLQPWVAHFGYGEN